MRTWAQKAVAAGIIALTSGVVSPPVEAVDSGVIRLAEPERREPTEPVPSSDPEPKAGARQGFDVDAFDGRFESLWFQRKAYQSHGRDDDAARQADLIREFVADEGVRCLEVPAGALLLEARGWLREGSYDKALSSLALADALDPGRPQIALARAHVLWASGAGPLASMWESLRAVRGIVSAALGRLNSLHGVALSAVVAVLGSIALFSGLMALRYQLTLRHDVEEWLFRDGRESWAKAGGWAVLWLPLLLWIGAGWLVLYWFVVFFRYMRKSERALAAVLLLAGVLAVPAYRFAVGLYGLSADPTVRTTLAAANGGYDPDRIVKLRALVDAHPDDPMYRFLLAGLYRNGRYFEDAFLEYKRVLAVAPSTYQARINLGNIYFVLGQYGQAISNYRHAIEMRPDSALAYYDMYLAQSESFNLKEASESLARARDLDPVQVTRLLTSDSREGGGPKAVDAAIDFNSIWRVTVEGRRLREWLEAEPDRRTWSSSVAVFANTTSFLALAALALSLLSLVVFDGRAPARRCTRCGRAFCGYCKPGREGHEYCSQCLHLFVLGDGLSPESKSLKLYDVARHEASVRRWRRLLSLVLPGAAQIVSGRCWIGFSLVMLWLLAWVLGYPEAMGPFERFLGFGVHWAALRANAIPDMYGLDAVVVLAIPLGVVVWLMGNVGVRPIRGV